MENKTDSEKNNSAIWIIGVVIIVIAGFYFWSNSSPSLTTAKIAEIPESYYQAMTVSGGIAKNLDGVSFSPDGKNVAYVVKQSDKSAVYYNDTQGPWYSSVNLSPFAFSGDGKHYFYSASLGNDSFVVVDGKEQQHYQNGYIDSTSLLLSTDGIPAFMMNVSGQSLSQYVVFNGHSGKTYRAVEYMKISPDGQSAAYYGCNKDNTYNQYASDLTTGTGFCSFVIQDLDGTTHEPGGIFYSAGIFEAIYHGNITYSPDGKLLAYTTRLGNEDSITVNGVNTFSPPGNYSENNISGIIFSPDSKHVAYIAQGCSNSNPCITSNLGDLSGGRYFTVLDNNTTGKEYDEIKNLTFDTKGQLAYFARTGNQWFLVEGENEYPTPDGFAKFPSQITFASDNSYLYTYTDISGETVLISNGQQIVREDYIEFPAFTPNGKVIYTGVASDSKSMSLVVDGVAHKHDFVSPFMTLPTSIYGPYYKFVGDSVIYGAIDGKDFYRVVDKI